MPFVRCNGLALVQSKIGEGLHAATVNEQLDAPIAALMAKLPPGYRIEVGGALSDDSTAKRAEGRGGYLLAARRMGWSRGGAAPKPPATDSMARRY